MPAAENQGLNFESHNLQSKSLPDRLNERSAAGNASPFGDGDPFKAREALFRASLDGTQPTQSSPLPDKALARTITLDRVSLPSDRQTSSPNAAQLEFDTRKRAWLDYALERANRPRPVLPLWGEAPVIQPRNNSTTQPGDGRNTQAGNGNPQQGGERQNPPGTDNRAPVGGNRTTPPGNDTSIKPPGSDNSSTILTIAALGAGGAALAWRARQLSSRDQVAPLVEKAQAEVKPEYKEPKLLIKDPKSGEILDPSKFDGKDFLRQDGTKVSPKDASYTLQIPEGKPEPERKAIEARLRGQLDLLLRGQSQCAPLLDKVTVTADPALKGDARKMILKDGESGKEFEIKSASADGRVEIEIDGKPVLKTVRPADVITLKVSPEKVGATTGAQAVETLTRTLAQSSTVKAEQATPVQGDTPRPVQNDTPRPVQNDTPRPVEVAIVPTPPEVLQRVAADLPANFTVQDMKVKLDEMISRERSRGEEADAKVMEHLEALKSRCEADPQLANSVQELLTRTRTQLASRDLSGAGHTGPVSNRPLERIGGATGTVVDGVVSSTTAGDTVAHLPSDVTREIDKQREELSRKLAELDERRKTEPRNEDLSRQRAEVERQMEDLQRAKTDPAVRGRVNEWLRANRGNIGRGVGAAALFLFIYSVCASSASASDRADHARIRTK